EAAAREPHTVTLCGGYELAPGWTHPLLRELPGTIRMPARLDRGRGLQAAVEILGAELDGHRLGADALKPVVLDMVILYVLRAWFEEHSGGETATGWAAALADPAVRTALNAVHDAPGHPWTVQELADRARLSRATFSRRFGALTGRPPLAYLTWWRMTVATELLRDPSASIAAVASRVGYTSEFAFANAFKRHFGTAPGRFRRQPEPLAHRPR
ncbi:AraC family transcriptional regulator, partial [Actinomadura sp. KC345]|uniref:helix-turn-helix transcriptional regulator n=1 Tax=Actinomadura sp. KC345 TaxID=2530371 RepID=UPI001045B6AE